MDPFVSFSKKQIFSSGISLDGTENDYSISFVNRAEYKKCEYERDCGFGRK